MKFVSFKVVIKLSGYGFDLVWIDCDWLRGFLGLLLFCFRFWR